MSATEVQETLERIDSLSGRASNSLAGIAHAVGATEKTQEPFRGQLLKISGLYPFRFLPFLLPWI
jgi:hypothetical protein